MKVSVVIPSFNRCDALKLTLEHLARQKYNGQWEVIVVNNNSTDDTDSVVQAQEFPCELKLVRRTTPGAVAMSRNAGARQARGEFLIFIDNDILVEPTFVADHVEMLEANPGCWILGAIEPLPEQEDLPLGQFRRSLSPKSTDKGVHETLAFTGANCSLPRRDFERLGGFDEGFFISSSEDQELAMRARGDLGVRVLSVPHIRGIHNDWAGWTFADYCRRQNLYSQTDYYFWLKYGEDHPRLQLVNESLPVKLREDSLRLIFRKLMKRVLGASVVQFGLIKAASVQERFGISRRVLWITYKLCLAGAINEGVRKGRLTVIGH